MSPSDEIRSRKNIRSMDAVDLSNAKGAPSTDSVLFVSYLFSSAVADAAYPIFFIFIPLFAVTLGASALELGLVGGAALAVYAFMPFIMGHFSDRRGSRIFFILSSFVVLCITSILYFVATDPVSIIVVRIFEGTGWAMLWPALDAAVTDDDSRDPKRSLSIYNYCWSSGAAAGPVLGTFLVTVYSYRSAFLYSSLMFVLLIILNVAVLLRRKKTPRSGHLSHSTDLENEEKSVVSTKQERPLSLSSSIRQVILSHDSRRNFQVWTSIATTALCSLVAGVIFTFFGPYATSLKLTVTLVGAVTTAYGVSRFLGYVALAKESVRRRALDPAKRIRNIIACVSIASLSSLLLMIKDPGGAVYFLSFILFAVAYSFVSAMTQATLIAETSKEQTGAGAGLFESSLGIGGAIGPVIAGAISSKTLVVSFIVPSAGLVFVLSLLAILYSITRRNTRAV